MLLEIDREASYRAIDGEGKICHKKAPTVHIAPTPVSEDIYPRASGRAKSSALCSFVLSVAKLVSNRRTKVEIPKLTVIRCVE